MPELISAAHRVGVERQNDSTPLLWQAESLIDLVLPPSTACPAPPLRSHLIDTYLKRHAWLRSTNGDGSAQRMPIITPFEAWLKLLHMSICIGGRFQYPAGIEGAEKDGIARIDGQDGGIVAGKGATQGIWRRFDTVSSHPLLPPCLQEPCSPLLYHMARQRTKVFPAL